MVKMLSLTNSDKLKLGFFLSVNWVKNRVGFLLVKVIENTTDNKYVKPQSSFQGEMVNMAEKASVEPVIPTVDDSDVNLLEELLAPRKNLPPLLLELGEYDV